MTYLISDAESSVTVREFLLAKGYSQALIRRLKCSPQGMASHGKEVHTNDILVPGDVLFITMPREKGNEAVKPRPMPLEVVFEDDHILVINKRAGVPVHPSQGNHENTLADYDASTDHSLANIRLETGRTHQIRVHLKHLGFPLPGDFLYNPDYRYIGRQALHSWRLDFLHPITKEPLRFEAPLPEDMKFILKFMPTEGLWDNDF